MALRERPRNRNSKAPVEEYVLVVHGAPLNKGWQELKDFIREYAPHLRQAEMYKDDNGKPTGGGSVIVRGLEEARRAYEELSRKGWNGHCIRVALARRADGGGLITLKGPTTSPESPSRPPNPMTYSNNPHYMSTVATPIAPRANHFSGYPAAADPQTAYYSTTGTYQPISVAQHIADTSNVMVVPYRTAPVPTTYTHYENPNYADISTTQQHYQSVMYDTAAPVYTSAHHATAPHFSRHPSNRSQTDRAPLAPTGTPNRTVFLSKLPYTAAGQAVRHLLEEFGTVERCEVPLDKTSPNKIQGTAIVKFNEVNDAARAIRNLNGTEWKGVTISARWDRESASTSGGSSLLDRLPHASLRSPRPGTHTEARREECEARDQRRHAGDGPLIVNGSRGNVAPSRSRRGSKQDDSDSDEYSDDDEHDSGSDKDARFVARRISGKNN